MMAYLLALTATIQRRWRFVAAAVIVLVAAGGVYWWRRPPRPNIVLVTFDTTRADRLGAYGFQAGATQGFDEFARQGVVFEQAYAPAPITLPSHATMLTGLYPPEHGLRVNGSGKLAPEIPVLTEILKEHGYDTGAFIAAVVLDSMYGLDRGFEVYDDDIPRSTRHFGEHRRDGQAVVDAALNWMRQRSSKPFFCWIHLYDAHAPYDPRVDVYQQKFADTPYDAGVAWEVEQFARVTAYLKEQQLDANTVVVVAGDHGEGLDEHQETEHGMLVYNTTLQVPFAFVGPRYCQPGTRVASAVSLVDLAPTLLEMLRIPAPGHVSGRSLLAALQGRGIDSGDCYAEADTPYVINQWSPLRAVISERWKYIETTRPELYNLEQDPAELNNLVDSAGEERQRLQELLTSIQDSFIAPTRESANLSERDLANLQALGYVSGGVSADASRDAKSGEGLPDVKDFLPELAKFEQAKHLALEGEVDEAITLLQAVTASTSEFPAADVLLGDCLTKAGRLDEAVATYRSMLARRPDYERLHFSLGQVLAIQGRHEDAAVQFREFTRRNPDAASSHFELAKVLTQLQRFDEAIQEYRETLHLAPDLVAAHLSLGQLYAMLRQPREAAVCYERALRYEAGNLIAHENLLITLSQIGEFTKAIQHGEQAVALDPTAFETRFNLGILLVSRRQYADGIAHLRAAQKLRPDDPRPGQQIEQAESAMPKGGR